MLYDGVKLLKWFQLVISVIYIDLSITILEIKQKNCKDRHNENIYNYKKIFYN